MGPERAPARGRAARRLAILLALVAATAAHAAPVLSVAPVGGDPPPALVRQLRWDLCDAFDCEPWTRVSTNGKPDLAKARELGGVGLLVGSVAGGPRHASLTLALFTRSRTPARRWRFRLNREGAVDPGAMRHLVADLEAVLGPREPRAVAPADEPPAPSPPPLPPPPAPRPPAPRPAPRAAASPPPAAQAPALAPPATPPPPVEAPARRAPDPAPLPPAPRAAVEGARRHWLAAEVGIFALRRRLEFEHLAVGAALLRGHEAPRVVGPSLHVEVFPAAALGGSLAGAGAFADYGISVGLATRIDGAEERPTQLSRLAVGATWRSRPVSPLRLVFAPELSYRSLRLTVQPRVPGLPDAKLSGVKGGLALELRVAERFSILASGGYVRWLSAQDLVQGGVAFFPGGSASALELEAGFSVGLTGPFALRVVGEYSATRYALDADPSGVYSARGARDTYLGGRAALRASY